MDSRTRKKYMKEKKKSIIYSIAIYSLLRAPAPAICKIANVEFMIDLLKNSTPSLFHYKKVSSLVIYKKLVAAGNFSYYQQVSIEFQVQKAYRKWQVTMIAHTNDSSRQRRDFLWWPINRKFLKRQRKFAF